MSKQFTERSVFLADFNGQDLAEFMIMEYADDPHRWIKCIPYFGMHETFRSDLSSPILVQAGMIMPDTSFLGYIATVARASEKAPAPYTMHPNGAGNYIMLDLVPGMHARDIATLTRFDIEMVREFYKSFFIVKTDDEWAGSGF